MTRHDAALRTTAVANFRVRAGSRAGSFGPSDLLRTPHSGLTSSFQNHQDHQDHQEHQVCHWPGPIPNFPALPRFVVLVLLLRSSSTSCILVLLALPLLLSSPTSTSCILVLLLASTLLLVTLSSPLDGGRFGIFLLLLLLTIKKFRWHVNEASCPF